ncbi:MAG: AMP-binding protein [Actinomycetota bacterium]|nr:AMP-binding protein [Actinomycetota bacterium]
MPTRPLLSRLPVPPGIAGVDAVLPALAAALAGSGPPVAPVPMASAAVSTSYVAAVLAAVRPDDRSAPLERDDVAVVLSTSGSTGDPRGVLLPARALTAMCAAANAMPDGGPGTPLWIVALPVTSMGGLNVLVRALASGVAPVALPSLGGAEPFTPGAFAAAVGVARSRSSDVRVSLVPAQVARLLADDDGVAGLRGCTRILVGGGPLRPSLRSIAAGLGIDLTATYGSTETAGGCVFDGTPLPGVTVGVEGEREPGRLVIEGPCLALGYRGAPELTAQCFVDGRFRTSDLGTVSQDGTVAVLGRIDDVVVVKGVNVSPAAVERVIEDLPDVAAAAVVAPVIGGEPSLHAFIEARDAAEGLAGLVEAAVEDRLGRAARPARVWPIDRLPYLPNGKVDRKRLEAWATGPGRAGAGAGE